MEQILIPKIAKTPEKPNSNAAFTPATFSADSPGKASVPIRELESPNSRIEALESLIKRLEEKLDGLARTIHGQIEPLRLELIERTMKEPLYKELARNFHHFKLLEEEFSGRQDILAALADEIVAVLETHGVSVIYPGEGECFDPKRHQAMHQRGTKKKEFHGKIAFTYHPGLSRSDRVIQPARVELFCLEESKSS